MTTIPPLPEETLPPDDTEDFSDAPAIQDDAPEMSLAQRVNALEPRINYHLHRYGLGTDPLAKVQAKTYAAQALKTYDPASGASFPTWLDRNMMPLTRFKRSRATAIHVPERVQLDAYKLERARMELEDKLGREPELGELADAAMLSVKRINQISKSFRKMPAEGAFEDNLESQNTTDWASEALDMIYDESDKKDRLIIEMKTGYGGKHQPMEPKDIALKLGMSPVDLSRRSTRITAKLDEIVEQLQR